MTAFRYGFAFFLCLPLAGPALAAGPTVEEIDRAVQQLGDDDFAVREKASRFLWEAGLAAEPALQKALKNPDAEVVLRAAVLLDKFRWGIYPDTPAEVVDLVKAFRSAIDDKGRETALRGLLVKGSKGLAVVRKIATADPSPEAQHAVHQLLKREAATAAPALLAEDKLDDLEEMLALAATSRERPTLQNYTAYLILRDRVGAKITELEPRADDPATAQMLAYLYRAKGNLATAVKHAHTAGDDLLIDTLLYLNRDWATLGERLASRKTPMNEESLGMLLTCQLRTGKKAEAEQSIAALRKIAENKPVGDGSIWWSSKPLFLNELTDEALQVLPRGRHYVIMFDVLSAQLRHPEAIELAENLRTKNEKGWLGTAVKQVLLLRDLGESKKADALLDELAGSDKAAEDWERRELVALLFEMGRHDQAFAMLVEHITKNQKRATDPWLWSAVFPKNRGPQAANWWACVRARGPKQSVADTVQMVRDIMDGKADQKELSETTFPQALSWAKSMPPQQWVYQGPLQPLAAWCADRKLRDQERECLVAEIAVRELAPAWQRLGEHDAAGQKWREAAESFRKAWEKDRTQGAPLWQWGWALEHAGDVKEGRRLMERARWLALGDDRNRYALAEAMQEAGRTTDGLRERALMNGRVSLLDSWYLGDAQTATARLVEEKGDYLAAADALELAMLRVVKSGTFYLNNRAWAEEPARVHYRRGRGLLAAGKVEEALHEARAGLKLLPGDVNVTIPYVTALEKLGRTKEADELFEKTYAVYTRLLRDYPNWARGRNDLAWLCVRCRRKLDEALKHAEKAVELEPTRTAYLDTLAEAHFQQGDQAKAIELMKKCLEREPDNDFFKKQLKRYEAGDPKTEVPVDS